jgi:hypothetical protein
LRALLTDPTVLRILHHGSGDALVLCSYDIAIEPVFDTAIADALLLQGDTVARNLGEVHDDWLLELMPAAYPERAGDINNGLLPAKNSFEFV